MKFNIYNNIILYVSLVFLTFYLIDNKLYSGFNIKYISYFLLSILLLFLGHIIYVIAWFLSLKKYNINKIILFESESVTIFNKYIPGKIWVVLGPVTYLKKFYNISLKEISQYSLYLQVVIIWTGLLLGFLFIYLLPISYKVAYVMSFFVLSLYLFSNKIHKLIERIIFIITKKSFNIMVLDFKHVFSIAVLSMLMWIIWSLAFYLFFLSTTNEHLEVSILLSFVFPIASVIGIVALFSPGGLGVREGIMIYLLISIGISSQEATQISIDSRIWFLIGEVIIFITALISILFRKYIKENIC